MTTTLKAKIHALLEKLKHSLRGVLKRHHIVRQIAGSARESFDWLQSYQCPMCLPSGSSLSLSLSTSILSVSVKYPFLTGALESRRTTVTTTRPPQVAVVMLAQERRVVIRHCSATRATPPGHPLAAL
ncbi:MAG: hypothetical protein MHM6MM_005552 [Cercozoa sp. M6MM]